MDLIRFQHLWFMGKQDAEAHKKIMTKLFDLDCKAVDAYVSEPDISVKNLREEMRRLKNRNGIPKIFYPELDSSDLMAYYKEPSKLVKRTCNYPWFNAHIKPNGDLLSCFGYALPYKYGNLRESSFEELWNNERAKKFRRELKKRGCFLGCKRCCGLFEH